jgi:acyl carrier protein
MSAKKEIYTELESILNLDSGSIAGSENLIDVNWDSMASVMFIALADEKFGTPIDINELKDVTTVEGLMKLLPIKE